MTSTEAVRLPQPILVLSDGTGETAEKVTRAALRQFRDHVVFVRTFSNIQREDQLTHLFRLAARQGAFVVTTLVQPPMRQLADQLSRELGVRTVDLIGNLLSEMEVYLQISPDNVPGLLHHTDDRYFKRIEAVEFTVKADDGKEPRMLRQADIVLVGVSRTSKTPLSTFLAHKGFKVANVPIVLDRPLPKDLFLVDPRHIFALTIDADALRGIRRSRLRAMGVAEASNYDDMDYILAELEYAEDLFKRNPEWPVVDVTSKAVEETAALIVSSLQERGLTGAPGDVSQL